MKTSLLLPVALVLLAMPRFAGAIGHATTAPAADDQPVRWPLASIPPLPSGKYGRDELQKMFPAFVHVPFDQAGFNPLQLPLHYEDAAQDGDPAEANAMAFLLSASLDWTPGNYCTFHSYFVFKRDHAEMQKLAGSYEPSIIRDEINRWGATHAVGGTVIHHKDGLTGTLVIYQPNGEIAFQRHFDKHESFFDLLGDFSVAAMNYFGHPPNDALAAFLHEPQCKNPQSIIDLGNAAWLPERGPAELGLYDKILQQDPDFSKVRYWYTNQRAWHGDLTPQQRYEEYRRAATSRLDLDAMNACNPYDVNGKTPPADPEFDHWIDQTEALIGSDSPQMLEFKLVPALKGRKVAAADVQRAMQVAQQYPNDQLLLDEVAFCNERAIATPTDMDMAASIYLAELQNRYQPGSGSKASQRTRFAQHANLALGRPDAALQFVENVEDDGVGYVTGVQAEALFNAGRFDDAAAAIANRFPEQGNFNLSRAGMIGVTSAATMCDRVSFDAIVQRFQRPIQMLGCKPMLDVYSTLFDGHQIPNLDAVQHGDDHHQDWVPRQRVLLLAQVDLMRGTETYRPVFERYAELHPQDRLAWFLYDNYQANHPSPHAMWLYRMLQWMYPDDPLAAQLVSARKDDVAVDTGSAAGALAALNARDHSNDDDDASTTRPASERAIDSLLKDTSPWQIACVVHSSIVAGDRASARKLADHFLKDAAGTHVYELQTFARHLWHMTDVPIVIHPKYVCGATQPAQQPAPQPTP